MVTKQIRSDVVLDALGHHTRRTILTHLSGGPMAVGELSANLPVSRPAVSKHLKVLLGAGLVEFGTLGTRNVFRLKRDGFHEAREYLDGFWDTALRNFQVVAEQAEPTE